MRAFFVAVNVTFILIIIVSLKSTLVNLLYHEKIYTSINCIP
jgi:hypothetical protein